MRPLCATWPSHASSFSAARRNNPLSCLCQIVPLKYGRNGDQVCRATSSGTCKISPGLTENFHANFRSKFASKVCISRTNVLDLTSGEVASGEQWRRGQGVDPVLGPQQVEQPSIDAGLEKCDVQAVVGLAVHAKILNLAQRDGLVL